MSTYYLRRHLLECVLDDGDNGTVSVTAAGTTHNIPVSAPGVAEATGTISIDLAIPDADQDTLTLSGGGPITETGSVIATVVTTAGSAGAGRPLIYAAADRLAAKCTPPNAPARVTTLTDAGTGKKTNIQITARPSIRGLFRDETEWRLPVVIRYRASMDA